MSNYEVQVFNGHWFDYGIVFGTREEATEYAKRFNEPSRIVEISDPANYRMENGKLVPGKKRLDPATCTWEDYVKGLGCLNPT